MIETINVEINDIIKFKKTHPCGGATWKVLRTGIDFKLECTTCKRVVIIPRLDVQKKATSIIKSTTQTK